MVGAACSWVSLLRPSSSAAAAMTSLNVEPGRVDVLDGPVEHRVARVRLVDLVPGLLLGLTVVHGERVRVVGRRAHHGEDLAGAGPDRDDRAGVALLGHRLVGGFLHAAVDRQHDAATARVAPGDQVGEPAHEQPVVRAVEDLVLGALKAAGAEPHRVEAGDRCVDRAVGVLPLVAQPVVGRRDGGDDLPVGLGDDLPALPGVLLEQHPLVARVGAVVVGLHDLDVGDVGEQHQHHDEHGEADAAQGSVHCGRSTITVWASAIGAWGTGRGREPVCGRRAASEIRSNRATRM